MSDYIPWITRMRWTRPPIGFHDDYKYDCVIQFCAEQRWTTAELTALSIEDEARQQAAFAYIERVRNIDHITALYADGGVIGRNPSTIGGTWAWRQVWGADTVVAEDAGVIIPAEAEVEAITNNLTELLALVRGIEALPKDWHGTIYSDSNISLGRLFRGWTLREVPQWLITRTQAALKHIDLGRTRYVLLDGHPTKDQLAAGVGKRGNLVSIHNVWCDKTCGEQAAKYLRSQQ